MIFIPRCTFDRMGETEILAAPDGSSERSLAGHARWSFVYWR